MSRRTFIKNIGYAFAAGAALRLPWASAQPVVAVPDAENSHPIDRIHQILIVDGFSLPSRLPDRIGIYMESLGRVYPAAQRTLWSGDAVRALIAQEFDGNVLQAFDMLKPYAYKSDLGRLCILFAQGGLYSDIALQHEQPWAIPTRYGFGIFNQAWRWRKTVSTVSNSLIWSQSKRAELALAIERIVVHCRERYYGDDPVDVTGPRVLGYACAAAATDRWRKMLPDDQYRGVHEAPSLEVDLPFIARENERTVVAIRPHRRPGDWSGVGLGTNNYQTMWNDRNVYV
ncbi:MAG: glycosyltransferase [Janthinobacterium lividum]